MDPWIEDLMKYPLPVCPFLYLSGVFLWSHLSEFSDFSHEVRVSSNLKSHGAWFFLKNLVIGAKMKFLRCYENQTHEIFTCSYKKIKSWGWPQGVFGKILFLGFRAKIDSKWSFSSFMKSTESFWFCTASL